VPEYDMLSDYPFYLCGFQELPVLEKISVNLYSIVIADKVQEDIWTR